MGEPHLLLCFLVQPQCCPYCSYGEPPLRSSASFLYLQSQWTAPDDWELSVFSGQQKICFIFSVMFSMQGARVHLSASSFSEQHMAISQNLPLPKLSRQQELHNQFTHSLRLCFFIQKAVHTRRPCLYLKRRWPNFLPLTAVFNRQSGSNHLC